MSSQNQPHLLRLASQLALPAERARLAAAAAGGAVAALAGAALLGLSGYLIVTAAGQPPVMSLTVAIVLVRGFGVLRAVATYLERLYGHGVVLELVTRLRARGFSAVSRSSSAGSEASTAKLERLVGDLQLIQNSYLRAVTPLASAVVVTLAALLLALLSVPAAAGVFAFGALIMGIVIPRLASMSAAGSLRRTQAHRLEVVAELGISFDAAAEFVMRGEQLRQTELVDAKSETLANDEIAVARVAGLASLASRLVGVVTNVAVLWLAISASKAGSIEPSTVAALALTSLAVTEVLASLAASAVDGAAARDAFESYAKVTAEEPDSIAVGPRLQPRQIEIQDLQITRAGRVICSGVNLDVWPSEVVALVGPSGSGKSTIGELLCGFLSDGSVEGTARLGGASIKQIEPAQLRQHVLLVPQAPYIFDSTLRANLLLASPEATDEQLRQALLAVGATGWLAGEDDGLDRHLGESGKLCSGGEQQRIGLARAMLADGHQFLVLDEPVSHLPEADALAALRALIEAKAQQGVLLIVHRAAERTLASREIALN